MSTPLNTPSAWRSRRLRVLALVLTVALLVLGVLMHIKPSALRDAAGAAQMAGEASAASPETATSSPISPFWDLAAQASARADAAEAKTHWIFSAGRPTGAHRHGNCPPS